jgi:hypothetical protein
MSPTTPLIVRPPGPPKGPAIRLNFGRYERMTPAALRAAFGPAVHITDAERWFDPTCGEWVTVVLQAKVDRP